MKLLGFFLIAYLLFSCKNEAQVDYSTEIKPILNKHCIVCHGGVKKQSGYSMLFKEEAFAKAKSGKYAIVPGNAAESELIKRLTTHDLEERMPYQKEPLSKNEIAVLTNWINQGAKWGEHWAYKPIKEPEIPNVKSDWIENPIDNFILANAKNIGLKPSEKSDAITIAKKLSLDIVGFPLSLSEKENFNKLPNKKTYEQLIDKLLASKHFGEKWASMWLDLARYADTKGYERDDARMIWRYRDYLINSFNQDKPYAEFIKEQLAGDLLPNPTEEQYIATAFHRNTMTNDEGGSDNEEFRTAAVMDRVNTTWETLMGTTFACVQCHSHPYDPFRHDEYYKFMAFFNNTRDEDTYGDYPKYRHYNDTLKTKLNTLASNLEKTVSPTQKNEILHFLKTLQPSYNSLTCDQFKNAELSDTKWLAFRNLGSARLKSVNLNAKSKLILSLKLYTSGGFLKIHKANRSGPIMAVLDLSKLKSDGKWQQVDVSIKESPVVEDLYFSYQNKALKNPDANGLLIDWLYFNDINFKKWQPKDQKIFWDLLKSPTESTPIMVENRSDMFRKTNVFERGSWLTKGKEVRPAIPALFGSLPKNTPQNRLGLAQWMGSAENPLVARTMVNRVWEQIFGLGLVETLEDLGTQSATPTNKELLDFLSYRFIHIHKWSVKKLIKEIVQSATYQQRSNVSKKQLAIDPTNKYLCRGPRVRLSSEQIRDQALAVSGLLCTDMHGPPVMPQQPGGIWQSPYNGAKWVKSEGKNQYRRAIYTFWKRTSPYPSMISFDAAGREVCVSRRIRTNTPLQALVTLNDSVFVEISKVLAEKSYLKAQKDICNSISIAYKSVTEKDLTVEKHAILEKQYQLSYQEYLKNPQLLNTLSLSKNRTENAKMAALMMVCNTILNLDEVLTKS